MNKLLIIVFVTLFANGAQSAFAEKCQEFKFQDKVIVIHGFYQGFSGVVTEKFDECTYYVGIQIKDGSDMTKLEVISSNDIEKVK